MKIRLSDHLDAIGLAILACDPGSFEARSLYDALTRICQRHQVKADHVLDGLERRHGTVEIGEPELSAPSGLPWALVVHPSDGAEPYEARSGHVLQWLHRQSDAAVANVGSALVLQLLDRLLRADRTPDAHDGEPCEGYHHDGTIHSLPCALATIARLRATIAAYEAGRKEQA